MRLADRFFLEGAFDKQSLCYVRQLGVTAISLNVGAELRGNAQGEPVVPAALAARLRDGAHWRTDDLVALRRAVEALGLELCSLAHLPAARWHRALYGLPGRDEDIENWCRSLKAMGEAGIPVLQYFWHSNAGASIVNWHTSTSTAIRGGAAGESFDYAQVADAPLTAMGRVEDDQLWDSLAYFLKAVIPVAEQAGVRMGMHPADPQVPSLAGIARIMRSEAAFDRLLDIAPSRANALTFCQGCFSQMLDAEGVYRAIARYVGRGAVAFVHFRNVTPDSTAERFTEAFWDNGKIDMLRAMQIYQDCGYDGHFVPDHHPHVIGDTVWGHRSRGFALGYMRGLLQAAAAHATTG